MNFRLHYCSDGALSIFYSYRACTRNSDQQLLTLTLNRVSQIHRQSARSRIRAVFGKAHSLRPIGLEESLPVSITS